MYFKQIANNNSNNNKHKAFLALALFVPLQ